MIKFKTLDRKNEEVVDARWENEGNVRVKCHDFSVYTHTSVCVCVKWVGCVYIISLVAKREITSGQKK